MPDWLQFTILAALLLGVLILLLVVYGHVKHVVELLSRGKWPK